MKQVIFICTFIFTLFSSYSYAEHTNHYTQNNKESAISTAPSLEQPFKTPHLNEDPRVNNK